MNYARTDENLQQEDMHSVKFTVKFTVKFIVKFTVKFIVKFTVKFIDSSNRTVGSFSFKGQHKKP
ncbi:hypothetical protein J6590_028523 [Homalodisca vitripennis]|nr:hypothetical protein J6590_028523 [Homalodisca vitripennis]